MLKDSFSQASYDKFLSCKVSATIKSQGGNCGGGSETLITQENLHDTLHTENQMRLSRGGGRVH